MESENTLDKKLIFEKIECVLVKCGKKYPGKENEKFEEYLYRIDYFSPEEKLFLSKEVYDELDENKSTFFLWWKTGRDYRLVAYKFNSTEKTLLENFWTFHLDKLYLESKRNL